MAMSISFSSSTFLTSASIPLAYSPSNFRSLNCFGRQKRLCISRWPTIRIRSEAVTLPVLTFDGERAGETCLDIKSARPETARAVVHRGVVTELQNRRRGTASTLTRAEVRGGGRKPYPQKKMGRARRGSQRTPLRRGGGVIFGPKPRDWSIKMNKKEKRLAITTALMSAAVNTVVVEDFDDKFLQPKTKDFIAALKRWGVQPTEHSLIFSTEVSDNVRLSSRNIGTLKILTPRNLNLYDVLRADKLILTKSSVEYLNRMYGLSPDVEEEEDQEEEEEDDDDDDDEGGGDLQTIPESADKNEGIGSPESAQ